MVIEESMSEDLLEGKHVEDVMNAFQQRKNQLKNHIEMILKIHKEDEE